MFKIVRFPLVFLLKDPTMATDVEEPRLETDDGEQEFQVEGALECQVCYDFFHASIFQCADGHIICENCFHQLAIPRNCPSCKGSYPNLPIRNRALERIASQAVALELVANRNQATAAPQAGQGVKRPAGGGAPGNRNGVRPICHSGTLLIESVICLDTVNSCEAR